MAKNFLDELDGYRRSGAVGLHEYLLARSSGGSAIYIFVEGVDDAAFYAPWVRAVVRRPTVRAVRCRGKDGVLQAEQAIRERTDYRDCIFFVDRDLCELLGKAVPREPSGRTFVTAYYSIESYLVDPRVLEACWGEILMFAADERLPAVLERYAAAYRRFSSFILPVMAWVMACRELGVELRLADCHVVRFIEVHSDLLVKRRRTFKSERRLDYLARVNGVDATCRPSVRRIVAWARALQKLGPLRFSRGHYAMEFFLQFLRALAAGDFMGGSASKGSSLLSESGAVALLAPRRMCPEDLARFLESVAAA